MPFKTVGDAHAALVSSEVHYIVFLVPSAMPLVKSAKARSVALPDVPGIGEAGLAAAESETLVGVVGPSKMPKEIVARLHRDIATVLPKPETKERFASQGGTPTPDVTPQAYGERLKKEHATYRKLIGELGLKPQ